MHSMVVWAREEGVALRREDNLGLRNYPISSSCDTIPLDLQTSIREDLVPRAPHTTSSTEADIHPQATLDIILL